MPQRSEDLGFSLMNIDSAYHNGIAGPTGICIKIFGMLDGGRKLEIESASPAGGLPVVTPNGGAMSVPLTCPGEMVGNLFNFGAGSNGG
ncbi:uncharacterized protein G2W53_028553 [Senna tora]|uniref:Uncharacterized protein n=1 Tax=Senna tora TaxID=362788 RepID=A0A834T2J2_9FABA|nr:uncharacterized protein G2W53_028553 [Senna tora]